MTTYPGPWIQAPDYVADGYEAIVSASPYGDTTPYEQHLLDDDDEPTVGTDYYTGADIKSLDLAVTSEGLAVPSGDVGEGFVRHDISYGAVLTSEGIRSKRSQEAWRSYRVAALSPESQGLRYWAPTPYVGITPPPDAIGWEWQDPDWAPGDSAKSEVLRLVAEFQFRHTTDDSSSSTYGAVLLQTWFTALEVSSGTYVSDVTDVNVTDADWLTEWDGPVDNYDFTHGTGHPAIFGGVEGVLFPDDDNPSAPALVDTYDLTSKLDDKGRIVIASSVSFQAGEPSGHVTPWSATGQDPLLLDDDTVTYGHAYNIVPHWTLRPPVFRWLYATPQITSAPPLRHTQRDDRHGPSPRNRPARSRQAGLRNTGYL